MKKIGPILMVALSVLSVTSCKKTDDPKAYFIGTWNHEKFETSPLTNPNSITVTPTSFTLEFRENSTLFQKITTPWCDSGGIECQTEFDYLLNKNGSKLSVNKNQNTFFNLSDFQNLYTVEKIDNDNMILSTYNSTNTVIVKSFLKKL